MRTGLTLSLCLLLGMSCKARKVIETTAQAQEQSSDQIAIPSAEEPLASDDSKLPPETQDPPTVIVEPTSVPTPPPAPAPAAFIAIKASANSNENCLYARKIDITESTLKITTDNFKLQLQNTASDTLQCLIMLQATIPKGKRLSLFILPQSYFAGLGMIATGQTAQLDINLLTLAGDNIEASMEYQTIAQGPIANDTEFLRSPQLIRRIVPPCQETQTVQRTLAIQLLLTLIKGAVASTPDLQTRDLPRIDYSLENCP